MGYSDNEAMVRVDFFKENGKWYTSEAIEWRQYSGVDIHSAFKDALRTSVGDSYKRMTAVCLEPYHEFAHPLMTRDW